MKTTVTFSKGGTAVTLPAPARFARSVLETGQARGTTAGGAIYVYELGVKRCRAELAFQSLTSAQKDSLAAFFEETASGMQETWTYTDPADVELEARFLEPALEFVQVAHDVWDVSVRLEISSLIG